MTLATALIDAPDWRLDLYRSGRRRAIAELYELRRLHEADPQGVERWIDASEAYRASAQRDAATANEPVATVRRTRSVAAQPMQASRQMDSPPIRTLQLHGRVEGQAVRVVLGEVPPEPAHSRST